MKRLSKAWLFLCAIFILAHGLRCIAEAACLIRSTGVSFGTYNALSPAPLDSNGSVIFRCEGQDHNITITLDKGGAPSFNLRRMLNGREALNYNLYLDPARTVIWGDGTGGTQGYFNRNPQPNRQDIVVPIHGRIPARQNVSAGNYTNSLTVAINF